MNNEINKLSEKIINKLIKIKIKKTADFILKEFIENSCDAKSTKIIIKINENKKKIKIIDNGIGLDKDSLIKIGKRYNTSKIKKISDLKNINSYGYRGESIYIIKNICKLQIISKIQKDEHGWKRQFQYFSNKLEAINSHNGTIMIANDVPNLKKKNLYNIFKYLSLSNFNIHFIFFYNNYERFNLPECKNDNERKLRISNLIKNNFINNNFNVNFSYMNIKLTGFITFGAKKNKNFLFRYFFLNNKYGKVLLLDKIIINLTKIIKLNFAIGYCLYLETKCDLSRIIIDEYKTEIKFKNNIFYEKFFSKFIKKYIIKNKDFFNLKKIKKKKKKKLQNCILLNKNLTKKKSFITKNKILGSFKNNIIVFQINGLGYFAKLEKIRYKLIIKKCILNINNKNKIIIKKIKPLEIKNIKYYSINNNIFKILNIHGFDLNLFNNTFLLKGVPKILYNFNVSWNNLLNEILKYIKKKNKENFLNNRIDFNIIQIFSNSTYLDFPLYFHEKKKIYKELLFLKENDYNWFKKNCFKIN